MSRGLMGAIRSRLSGPARSDAGVALVVVLSVILLLTLVVTAGVRFAVNQQIQSRGDQDWQAALAAAQAGVDDYTAKLNSDGIYWKYGKTSDFCPGCTFLTGSTTPTYTNPAFSGWAPIPGAAGRGEFRYDVDNSLYPTRGIVKLRASGRSGDKIRTIEVQVRRGGFIDFLYFTDYELLDPTLSGGSCTPEYWYDNTGRCGTDIQFIPQDAINGPAHSNDAILMCTGSRSGTPTYGPVFNDRLSTGYDGSRTSGVKYRRTCTSSAPYVKIAGDPRGPVVLAMPPSNTDYVRETDPAQVVAPDLPGCRYTGPTKIVLNSNGTMTVTSPATKSPHPVAGCAGGSTTGVTVAVPASGIIYVQNVPATADQFTKTPNTTSACTKSGSTVTNNGVGYPISGEDQSQEPSNGYRYSCTNGDVFVSGSLNGRLTVAAENSIVVTSDVVYAGGINGDDLLGLIPNQSVLVYHPINSSGNNVSIPGRSTVPNTWTINAAMLAVNKSFRVMNWNKGAYLGQLTVFGSIAQKFRGPVGTGSGGSANTGYIKDYNYDYRLAYDAPPKFLGPVVSPFVATQWTETPPAYTS